MLCNVDETVNNFLQDGASLIDVMENAAGGFGWGYNIGGIDMDTFDFNADGAKPIGIVMLNYSVEYRNVDNAPETAI